MALDEELESLNVRIRQLRSQFDLFFAGALPKPPLEARNLLEKDVKRVGTTREMKLAQRFLYNTLLNRWNIFAELWNKRLQEKEEGNRKSVVARRRAADGKDGPAAGAEPFSESPESPSKAPAGKPADGRSAQRHAASEKKLVARAAIRDVVDASGEDMKTFYKSFLEARQETGNGRAPSYEKFCQEIQRQASTIREKTDCERVDFRLYLEDNRVSLKAKPVKGKQTSEVEEERT